MVKYINGEKAPELYRKYKITQPNPQDDLASMREVLTRRFNRLKEGKEKMHESDSSRWWFTQCQNRFGRSMKRLGVDIPLAGLAKNDKHETDTLINADTGEEIPLEKNSPLFFLLMRMQDEIHRYAITYHRGKRAKAVYKTIYDDIKGIGEKRKQKLLDLYPTMESLEGVSSEELLQLVPQEAAQAILDKREQYDKEKAEIEAHHKAIAKEKEAEKQHE